MRREPASMLGRTEGEELVRGEDEGERDRRGGDKVGSPFRESRGWVVCVRSSIFPFFLFFNFNINIYRTNKYKYILLRPFC